jgi:hypothetical protein
MRKADAGLGYWTCEAPLTDEQRHEDMRLLIQIQLPEDVFMVGGAAYWVNAHQWSWDTEVVCSNCHAYRTFYGRGGDDG